jgi:hypothetical protein
MERRRAGVMVIRWPWFVETFQTVDGTAIAIGPLIIVSKDLGPRTMRHELLHARQWLELGGIGFWLAYLYYYVKARLKGFDNDKAHDANPFEDEARAAEKDEDYMETRKPYAWVKFIKQGPDGT